MGKQSAGVLVDLHVIQGSDDLLLGISTERTWADLLHVASELSSEHLERAVAKHARGFSILAAPGSLQHSIKRDELEAMLISLSGFFPWAVVDVDSRRNVLFHSSMKVSDQILLVTTLDPPSLRTAHRLVSSLPDVIKKKSRLIVNQGSSNYPIDAESAASSLGLPLIALISLDSEAIKNQIYFGEEAIGSFALSTKKIAQLITPAEARVK
jgi:Flp pilus assembly CpaE family ATPase